MVTPRERFLQTCSFQPVDLPFVRARGGIPQTRELWRQQGWDGGPLHELFGTDALVSVAPHYGPVPHFTYQVLEEDERTLVYINHEGIVMREFKKLGHGMPQFIKFPVASAEDFDLLAAERLALSRKVRFGPAWMKSVQSARDSEWPLLCMADRWGGFFGPLRNLMGLEELCVAFHERPALVERMMAERAEAIIAITEETLKHVRFQVFAFWEDMAYKNGSLIDPRMFRRFALPHYRRVVDWLHSQGIELIFLDSDGDIRELIPFWLEAGINGLWPFEVQSGMDVLEVRRAYGHDLVIIGGIDKRPVAEGGEAMRREVDRVMPLVEDGGYLPELDHGAPPNMSWATYREYMAYLLHRLGRG